MELLLCVLLMLIIVAPALALVLVEDARPTATVVLPEDASETLRATAERLQHYVERSSGARLPIVTGVDSVSTPVRVFLGSVAEGVESPAPDTRGALLGYDGCYVLAAGDDLFFLGPRDAGVANGVSWFLEEKLGIHVLGFGPHDTVLPAATTIEVEDFTYAHKPSFAWRESWTSVIRGADWISVLDDADRKHEQEYYAFNRRGGVSLSGSHSLYQYVPDSLFVEHPEYFPEIGGKRTLEAPQGRSVQRELSNPEVLRLVIEALRRYPQDAVRFATVSPNDDPYWSESEADLEMAVDPAMRMLLFCNRVVEALEPTHPHLGACFLAYSFSRTMEPPLGERAHERVVPLVAPLGTCPVHGPRSDACPDHGVMRRIYDGWLQVADKVTTYPYIYANILPLPMPAIVAEEIIYFHDLGLFGVQREHMARGFGWELSYWLEWQLLWDAEADVERLRKVFLDGWYRAAAAPMTRILERLERAVSSAPAGVTMEERDCTRYWRGWFRGWTDSFNRLPPILLETVAANRADLEEARRLAETPGARAHVERDATDLAAMEYYARGRIAFDEWDGSRDEAARLKALETVDAGVNALRPLREVSAGVQAPLGQLLKLRGVLEMANSPTKG